MLEHGANVRSEKFAPELNAHECPPIMALKSVHNTTIEGFWHWLREKTGNDIKTHLLRGQEAVITTLQSRGTGAFYSKFPYVLYLVYAI